MRGAALLVVAMLAACGSPPRPVSNHAPPPKTYSRTAADVLGFLPGDADIVMALDAARLRHSALWSTIEPGISRMAKLPCMKEIIDSIDSVAGAIHGAPNDQTTITVLRGPERSRVVACFTAYHTAGTTHVVGDLAISTSAGSSSVLGFADDHTAVIVSGAKATPASFHAVLESGSALRGSTSFGAIFPHVDPAATMWIAIDGNGETMKKTAGGLLGSTPRYIVANAWVGDKLTLRVVLALVSATDATNLVATMKPQLGAAKSMLEQIDIDAHDADVELDVVATPQQLLTIAGMLGGMFGP